MLKRDDRTGTYYLDGDHDASEVERLDKRLKRVSPEELRWYAPGHEVYKAKEPTPMRGLGDVIHRITSAVGIPQCGGCKQRQETLNKWVPFGKQETSEPSASIPTEDKNQ